MAHQSRNGALQPCLTAAKHPTRSLPTGCYASSRSDSEPAARTEAMKASMLHKQGGPSPKHRAAAAAGGPGGGSPLHGQAAAQGAMQGAAYAAAAAATAAVEDDEVSDYTDADESISAPTEFLAEVSTTAWIWKALSRIRKPRISVV